ncbi:MAG: MATE family efflux transporter [Anaerolineae bacterium]
MSLADKKFLLTMYRLASPIVAQNFIIFSLGMVDVLMIGQLGEGAVAAVGVADQVFFLAILMFFGITSGAAIFTAQYWGKKDIRRIRSVLGLCLAMSLAGALFFSTVAVLAPAWVIGIYSTDPEVIALGSSYLRVVGLSYAATAITTSYSAVLRSIENVKLPMLVSLMALSLNTVLNYGLIFGNFGLPALGVTGAAIATAGSRALEAVLLLVIIYGSKLPVAASPAEMFDFSSISLPQFFKTTLPVVGTEIAWSFGITTYNIVFARIGTESIAAFNIAATVDRLIFVIFIGLGNACAIMIGNRIGAGEQDIATSYGKRYLVLGPFIAVLVGLIMVMISNPILSLYKVSADTVAYARYIMLIMAMSLPIRSSNLLALIGILRSGGDTRYAFFIDAGAIWCIGVPLAFLGAFVLQLPVHWVYLMVMTEEVVKLILSLQRFFSQRWMHMLAVPASG